MNEKTTPPPAGTIPVTPPHVGHDDKSKTATMTPPATEPVTPTAAPQPATAPKI